MINKKELAEFFKVSLGTIDNFMRDGMPYMKIGKSVRFDKEKVIEWFKNKYN